MFDRFPKDERLPDLHQPHGGGEAVVSFVQRPRPPAEPNEDNEIRCATDHASSNEEPANLSGGRAWWNGDNSGRSVDIDRPQRTRHGKTADQQ